MLKVLKLCLKIDLIHRLFKQNLTLKLKMNSSKIKIWITLSSLTEPRSKKCCLRISILLKAYTDFLLKISKRLLKVVTMIYWANQIIDKNLIIKISKDSWLHCSKPNQVSIILNSSVTIIQNFNRPKNYSKTLFNIK